MPNLVVAGSSVVLAGALVVACGGGSYRGAGPTAARGNSTTTRAAFADVVPTAADFANVNRMTRVGDHFVGSLNGHLAAALAVARAGKGEYPVGTVIQLVPSEAMVKRHAGYSPATADWEFFSLAVSARGTRILKSGSKVLNAFGGDCASCHEAAAPQFDFVCGKNHGCAPLPLSDALIRAIQRSDPRPKH